MFTQALLSNSESSPPLISKDRIQTEPGCIDRTGIVTQQIQLRLGKTKATWQYSGLPMPVDQSYQIRDLILQFQSALEQLHLHLIHWKRRCSLSTSPQ